MSFRETYGVKSVLIEHAEHVQVDISTEVGVVHDLQLQELRLYTDYGRCSRPLFIVKDQQLTIKKQDILKLQTSEESDFSWNELIKAGMVE